VATRTALPILEVPVPDSLANPRAPELPADALREFATDETVQPTFHVWTLGCQMNVSDSEEMAGALLAAGCAEAASLEGAELIVINTCSIREAAEQKVIGRMGVLGKLGLSARDVMRNGEDAYKANNLGDTGLSEDQLIAAMVANPILIERPIVVKGGKAVIGRPPENVLKLI